MMRPLALTNLLCAMSLLTAQKNPDLRISHGPALSGEPQIAASGSSVYITWLDQRNGKADVYFNRSHDRGNTWLDADVRLETDAPGAARSMNPQIAVSGATVYVLWMDDRAGTNGLYLTRSLDAGDHWLRSDVRVDDGASGRGPRYPALAVSGSHVYVAWSDFRNGPFQDVFFNRSLDGGTSWLPSDVRLDTDPSGSGGVRIAASGTHVHVVWSDARNGAADIYFNRSLDSGTTWLSSDLRLDTDVAGAALSTTTDIAASGSAVYVAWEDWRNGSRGRGDIYFNRSLDGGTNWLPTDVRLDTDRPGAGKSGSADIAVSGSDVYVAWSDGRNSTQADNDIYFNRSTDSGTTWLRSDVRLDTDPPGAGNSWPPEIAATGSAVFVAWRDSRRAPAVGFDMYVNYSLDRGATWLARDVRLDSGAAGPSDGTTIAASDAHAYVAWHDDRTGTYAVYFNIPFGSQPYGDAKPGSGNVAPRIESSGLAVVGQTPNLEVTRGSAGAVGALLVGGSSSKVSLPILDGTLLVRPLFTLPLALDGAGATSVPLAIPVTFPAGTNVNFQAVLADPGAPFGFAHSAAIEMWIGR